MNDFVVLSEKTWNTRLVENLKINIPGAQWLLIDDKIDFSLEKLKKSILVKYLFHIGHIYSYRNFYIF